MKRKIIAVITTVLGYRVVVDNDSLIHALKHFYLPEDIFLELLERILKDPTEVYIEQHSKEKIYHLFYRLEKDKYLLAVVKVLENEAYFASMYTTGSKIKTKHKNMKRVKL